MDNRNFNSLEEPPRSIPFYLTLKLFFGGIKASIPIIALFYIPGFGDPGSQAVKEIFSCYIIVILYSFYLGSRDWLLLKKGVFTFAVLKDHNIVSRRGLRGSIYNVHILTFEYTIDGNKLYHTEETKSPDKFLDDPKEPIFLKVSSPNKSKLLDTLPANVYVDEFGKLKCKTPWVGYILFAYFLCITGWLFYNSFLTAG